MYGIIEGNDFVGGLVALCHSLWQLPDGRLQGMFLKRRRESSSSLMRFPSPSVNCCWFCPICQVYWMVRVWFCRWWIEAEAQGADGFDELLPQQNACLKIMLSLLRFECCFVVGNHKLRLVIVIYWIVGWTIVGICLSPSMFKVHKHTIESFFILIYFFFFSMFTIEWRIMCSSFSSYAHSCSSRWYPHSSL